jgi:DNA-binding winged helix-turn-helix (wHTH) protein
MSDLQKLKDGFRIGDWLVNPSDGSLSSSLKSARLEPQIMGLLVFLCSRAAQVVTREEIFDNVWHGRFVSDETLKAALYQLRKALGDSSQNPRYIETLPKRGYRLMIEPVPIRAERSRSGAEANDLYRKGTAYFAPEAGFADLKQARLYFERAVKADSLHSDASIALAQVYIRFVEDGLASGAEVLPKAQSLAGRAIECAPESSSAHVALAIASLLHDRDISIAEQHFLSAIELDPASAPARHWYAKLLSFAQRHDEAVCQAQTAVQIDTHSLLLRRGFVEALFMARRYGETVHECEALLGLSGYASEVQLGLSWVYYVVADHQRAFDVLYAGFSGLGMARPVLDQVVSTFQRSGIEDVFRIWAGWLNQQAVLGRIVVDLLVLYALLGEADAAFEMIDGILNRCHPSLLWLPASPLFDKLRSDPRYRAALALARAR